MDADQLELRKLISDSAVELYMKNEGMFTIRNVAARATIGSDTIYSFYASKQEMLADFYNLVPALYKEHIQTIPDYNQFLLADRISSFIFTTFDVLSAQQSFVEQTFGKITDSTDCKPWRSGIARILMDIFDNDPRVSDINRALIPDIAYDAGSVLFSHIIQFWIDDTSDGTGKTLALVEKSTALIQEIMYTDVLGKGIDLFRFLYAQVGPDTRIVKSIRKFSCSDN